MFKAINVLMICNEDRATSLQRQIAFRELGCNLHVIYTSLLNEKINILTRLCRALKFRLGYFPERNNENKKIKAIIGAKYFHIVFIEKGLSIKPSTLKHIKLKRPDSVIISYTLDDMMNKHNSSRYYRNSLPLYDYHFTNKNYNVDELKARGAQNIIYFRNAFSPAVHRPVDVSTEDILYYGSDVAFIGTYEKERVAYLLLLANHNFKIKIWGWSKDSKESGIDHPNITNMSKHVYGDDYAKVVCSSKINLCFLRKANRDKETTRSIEIPACGGFMLAERTAEHLSLFEEGKEAEFFKSTDELLQKITYYLINEEERKEIAKKGFDRCIQSKYDYNYQLENILQTVLKK